jgi:uncharacterized protein YhjY with autotransporter beta-barrel domain
MSFDGLTVGPRAGFSWVRNDYNSYNERGNSGLELRFNNDHRTSLQSSVGAFASYAISTGFGVIVPQAGVSWIHEFENAQRDIGFSFVGDIRGKTFTFQNERPDQDFLEINAGTSLGCLMVCKLTSATEASQAIVITMAMELILG